MKTKEEYLSYLHKKIDEWNDDIDRLMDKAERLDAKSRAELDQQIRMLKIKRDEIERKTTEISQSGAAAWEDIKTGLDLAWEAMNLAIKAATTRFYK